MVRNFPTGETSPHHPLLSITFIVAFIAAVVTIISSLCGFMTKKKQKTSSSTTREPPLNIEHTQNQNPEVRNEEEKKKPENPFLSRSLRREPEIEPLPPPPGMGKLRASSYHARSSSNASSQIGKLSTSVSMKSIGALKKATKKQASHVKNKASHEDSIWKKTIILGEKCRVPDDEEEAVVYDEKGKRIPTFHRKQSMGIQISRQSSAI